MVSNRTDNPAILEYTPEELDKIRLACADAQSVLVYLEPFVKPGVSTLELDTLAYKYITEELKDIPACLGYRGYQHTTCISINEVICHGIPSEKTILKEGDIVNIDVTVIKDGFYGDTSKMYIVGGKTFERAQELVEATQEALYNALRVVKEGARLNDIGVAIHKTVTPHNFSIVREFIGHGIGSEFHTAPEVLHYPNHDDMELKAGMVFTIEPMINAGDWRSKVLKDGWTAVTRDRKNSAQFEHQILVTKDGCEVMTIRDEEIKEGRIQRHMVNV